MALMAASLTALVAFSLLGGIFEKEFSETRETQEGGILPLLAYTLLKKHLEKESRGLEEVSREQEEDIIIWIIWIKFFSSAPSFNQYGNY